MEKNTNNNFAQLDAQNEVSAFAKLAPQEVAEFDAWQEMRETEFNRQFTEWNGNSDGTIGLD